MRRVLLNQFIRRALFVSLLAFGVSAASASVSEPRPPKLGVLDWQELLAESDQAKAAGKRLETKFQARQESLDEKKSDFVNKQKKLQRDRDVLSDNERAKAQKELTKLEQDLRHLEEELRSDYTSEHRDEMDNFVKLVRQVVDELKGQEKYTIIFPQEATLSIDESVDVTKKVLQRLSKLSKSKSSASSAGTKSGVASSAVKSSEKTSEIKTEAKSDKLTLDSDKPTLDKTEKKSEGK